MSCDVPNALECESICTLGNGVTIDPVCLANCLGYYCPGGLPSPSSGSAGGLSPAVVDSLDRFFLDGLYGGISFASPFIAGLFFLLFVAWLFVSAVKNS